MNEEQLKTRMEWWQQRLRLQDWKIQIKSVDPKNMDEAWGRAFIDIKFKETTIHITSPEGRDQKSYHNAVVSAEFLIVHELLEVMFARLIEALPEEDNVEKENVINLLSHTLVGLAAKADVIAFDESLGEVQQKQKHMRELNEKASLAQARGMQDVRAGKTFAAAKEEANDGELIPCFQCLKCGGTGRVRVNWFSNPKKCRACFGEGFLLESQLSRKDKDYYQHLTRRLNNDAKVNAQ